MPITATITNAECLYYLKIADNDDGTYLAQYTLGEWVFVCFLTRLYKKLVSTHFVCCTAVLPK